MNQERTWLLLARKLASEASGDELSEQGRLRQTEGKKKVVVIEQFWECRMPVEIPTGRMKEIFEKIQATNKKSFSL